VSKSRKLEYAAILLLTAIWGSAFAFIKIALQTFTPSQLIFARFVPTLPVFAFMAFWYRADLKKLAWPDWVKLAVAGLFASTIYNIALNTGETKVGAGLASLVIALNPAVILLGAFFVHGERVKVSFLGGMALSFVGVFILTLARNGIGFDRNALSGIVVILLCPVSWATYTILLHDVLDRCGAMAATSAASTIGILTMLPFAPMAFPNGVPYDFNGWMCALFLGIFSTVIGFTIWTWLLQKRGAARTGMVVYLNVVWGLLFAGLILGEVITWQTASGAFLILAGVAASRYSGRTIQK